MFRKLTSLFIFFCCLYRYSLCDCFYIFDVGQGNCQLAVFEDEKIGIMYDCGSSSAKEHVKISALKQEEFIPFLNLNLKQKSQTNKSELLFEEDTDINKISKKRVNGNRISRSCNIQKNFSKETDMVETNKKDKNVGVKIGNHIQKIIALHKLEYLFIILSHPDEDHINLIPHTLGNFQGKLPITVICGGDWLKHKTKDVKEVLDFLRKNETMQVRFPLYPAGVENYVKKKDGINKIFKDHKGNNTITTSECECKKLYDFVEKGGDFWTKDKEEILENVEIAYTKTQFKGVNFQSAIVKIKMKELKTQFFLTGDAENETFEQIKNFYEGFFKKDEGYISLVMLPHHGSVKNFFKKSKKSIENESNLFYFFNPDIIGVSAGNGNKYKNRHPDKELVDWITKQEYNGKVLLKNSFESMIMYQKGESDDGFLFENGPEKMPFICTNLWGDIKISKDESSENLVFSAKFSNIFKNEKDGISYEIDFLKHVDNPKFSNATKYKIIQGTSKNRYYLCLKYNFEVKDEKGKKHHIKTKPLYYRAIKLENDALTVANTEEQ